MKITKHLILPDEQVEIRGIRASGPGGQNVNKVSSAAHLRFDIRSSSLPENLKARLILFSDARINDGVVVLKASRFRTFGRNRTDAMNRLAALIRKASARKKPRKPTKPTTASKERRLKEKARRAEVKKTRRAAEE